MRKAGSCHVTEGEPNTRLDLLAVPPRQVCSFSIPKFFRKWERDFEVYSLLNICRLSISTNWSIKLSFEGKTKSYPPGQKVFVFMSPSHNFPHWRRPYFSKFWGTVKLWTGLGLLCYRQEATWEPKPVWTRGTTIIISSWCAFLSDETYVQ